MQILTSKSSLNVYRGTLTGLRISAVDGTALLDNCAALVAYADGNHLIEVYDSAGAMIRGFPKAVGSGETLATAIIDDDCADDSTAGWVIEAGASQTLVFDTDHYNYTNDVGGGYYIRKVGALVINTLLKFSGDYKDGTASGASGINIGLLGFPVATRTAITTTASFVTHTGYATVSSGLEGGSAWQQWADNDLNTANIQLKNVWVKQVLTPSSAGCTIVSAKGGETYNFAYKSASFTYNAASYYVVVKKAR